MKLTSIQKDHLAKRWHDQKEHKNISAISKELGIPYHHAYRYLRKLRLFKKILEIPVIDLRGIKWPFEI